MKQQCLTFKDPENVELFVYKWIPEETMHRRAVIQIAHGMAETAGRYQRFAEKLTQEGYIVYAHDHRGHGKTAGNIENVGYIGKDGFNWMVKDMHQLTDIIYNENPDLPVFLFGHSMGSFLAQQYMTMYGEGLAGVILSGSNGRQGPEINLGIAIARYQMAKEGAKYKSELLNRMSFGSYNKAFKPVRTEFDWLSSDPEEVDRYVGDPFCGTIFTAGFFYDFFRGLKKLHIKKVIGNVPKNLPIYIFSGEMDPVGRFGRGVKQLTQIYRDMGVKDVSLKLYKGGRHEMLNEINREGVMEDVIQWLNTHVHI